MEEDKQGKDAPKQPETIDASRRKLLGSVGKAAWIAPTLVLLSSRKAVAEDGTPPPPPPPPCGSNCTTSSSRINSNRRPKRPRSDSG